MVGSILGDIAGSRFEFSRPSGFDWRTEKLFAPECRYTDDSVMTIASKYALLTDCSFSSAYRIFGKRYPHAGYGAMFQDWLTSTARRPYQSCGNGSAMRAGVIGEYYDTLEKTEAKAAESAACTHNHPEGIKGAKAAAAGVFLARKGFQKSEIRSIVQRRYGYNLTVPLALRRPFCRVKQTCQATLPLAFLCFLESEDYESCIRNVFSCLCDTDTVGCIAGGFAEAYYKGTGFDDDALLRRYLIKPGSCGKTDTFLYDWAVALKDPYTERKGDASL
ncbi:MAG: ADP-ribosylglycohydrolase family protein [Oscillospiraceae bacterium]|jgi:ADP-ribosylglycohydrolase|nr:ADP-ribosylglycohydrolase family protein [Oscillospiraceae bacterium]MDD3261359.1 ADP-ribosylglycohydrolase family protein [Oscillospiraceae bacterium]